MTINEWMLATASAVAVANIFLGGAAVWQIRSAKKASRAQLIQRLLERFSSEEFHEAEVEVTIFRTEKPGDVPRPLSRADRSRRFAKGFFLAVHRLRSGGHLSAGAVRDVCSPLQVHFLLRDIQAMEPRIPAPSEQEENLYRDFGGWFPDIAKEIASAQPKAVRPEELHAMLRHLAYEYLAGELAAELAMRDGHALVLESALLHIRNLRAFFFNKASAQRTDEGAEVVAESFFDTPGEWRTIKGRMLKKNTALTETKRAIDQQLAHLNTNRARQELDVDLLPRLSELWSEVEGFWSRYEKALSEDWRIALNAAVAKVRQERFSAVLNLLG